MPFSTYFFSPFSFLLNYAFDYQAEHLQNSITTLLDLSTALQGVLKIDSYLGWNLLLALAHSGTVGVH